jgi:hypothetical protein
MIRRIRDLLYEQGFTISGARNKMQELAQSQKGLRKEQLTAEDFDVELSEDFEADFESHEDEDSSTKLVLESAQRAGSLNATSSLPSLRRELMDIRDLLSI